MLMWLVVQLGDVHVPGAGEGGQAGGIVFCKHGGDGAAARDVWEGHLRGAWRFLVDLQGNLPLDVQMCWCRSYMPARTV